MIDLGTVGGYKPYRKDIIFSKSVSLGICRDCSFRYFRARAYASGFLGCRYSRSFEDFATGNIHLQARSTNFEAFSLGLGGSIMCN